MGVAAKRYLRTMQVPAPRNTFPKKEKLCSRSEIGRLFDAGMHTGVSPLKAIYVFRTDAGEVAQTVFVVPKRRFRRANQRNLLRRRMREAFRLNKQAYYDALRTKDKKVSVALIYNTGQPATYAEIERAMVKLLEKLAGTL